MIPNPVYEEIIDICILLNESGMFDPVELQYIIFDEGYYSACKLLDKDVDQFDLDRLEDLRQIKKDKL